MKNFIAFLLYLIALGVAVYLIASVAAHNNIETLSELSTLCAVFFISVVSARYVQTKKTVEKSKERLVIENIIKFLASLLATSVGVSWLANFPLIYEGQELLSLVSLSPIAALMLLVTGIAGLKKYSGQKTSVALICIEVIMFAACISSFINSFLYFYNNTGSVKAILISLFVFIGLMGATKLLDIFNKKAHLDVKSP